MVASLIRAYPAIREDLEEEAWAGLTTLEVSCFARYTQAQIDSGHRTEVTRCFETARELFLQGDADVSNAICVSYLEHLNFADGKAKRAWATAPLPDALRSKLPA